MKIFIENKKTKFNGYTDTCEFCHCDLTSNEKFEKYCTGQCEELYNKLHPYNYTQLKNQERENNKWYKKIFKEPYHIFFYGVFISAVGTFLIHRTNKRDEKNKL